MKTLYFTYGVKPKVMNYQSVLFTGQEKLEQRGLTCEISEQERLLVASYEHKNWQKSQNFPINSYWDITFECLRFKNMRVLFTEALIPSPEKTLAGYEWMNGESYFFPETTFEGSIKITMTCLPTPETIELSMDIEPGFESNQYRISFIETLRAIENKIVQTKTFLDSIRAFRKQPVDKGYISRTVNKHFLAIARY
jgi:hypothetical protein